MTKYSKFQPNLKVLSWKLPSDQKLKNKNGKNGYLESRHSSYKGMTTNKNNNNNIKKHHEILGAINGS